jgi:hypothetical protein
LNGVSIFIIGQGRSGKSGLAHDFIEGKAPAPPMPEIFREDPKRQKWIIISPTRATHPALFSLDYITDAEPEEGTLAEKILKAWEKSTTHLLIMAKNRRSPALFEALGEEDTDGNAIFYGHSIYLDEAAIVTQRIPDQFEEFVRQVGQRDMIFLFSSHRIVSDISPVVSLNCMWIIWVGPLMDTKEMNNLYERGNVTRTRESLELELSEKVKYPWWDEKLKKTANSLTVIKTA